MSLKSVLKSVKDFVTKWAVKIVTVQIVMVCAAGLIYGATYGYLYLQGWIHEPICKEFALEGGRIMCGKVQSHLTVMKGVVG